ncbi:class I SAM-dependent DNA methyltransferase [Staphylococcus arlettae]|uniref:class I SAM-dependent DNA methyltransferase n=1 Tax=Staphylococcus arlettae TaxID=29378 RepID=UPI000DCF383B|nr:class I SAM-dependent methyltransferase [Staphylococcus arlettae]RBA05044.1 dTDP-3-amino-3,6-dideoxy-alpha-D-glucopyranose N,N-dimethyltransferase [Staphylococcus arlettae]RBA06132.1 dTDP-3-amino-3,6-dideoxy-alpha-D-glucopyranose N,N-dimethyltransferase [Staphylococcus arlettae]RBA06361.1 dTDP-3-amino-3,6-dideoxy-alpha-D-glucopyranose N,N-dimethyltransferase [Staphylococcus arlettae]
MVQYEELSLFYDQLTFDQPYESWLAIVNQFSNDKQSILDIGCGTGSLTSLLTEFDQVTGMDLSIDMLSLASSKSQNVNWIEGDMTDFNLNQSFSVISIFCDSLNYLTSKAEVQSTFEHVYQHLSPDGVFMFDVHTIYKMQTLFNNQSYINETADVFLGWDAVVGEEPCSVWHDMTFFVSQANGVYKRFDESHYQRSFEEAEYRHLLQAAGFTNISTFVDFDTTNHSEEGYRLFFIVRK